MKYLFLVVFIVVFSCKEVSSEKFLSEIVNKEKSAKDYSKKHQEALTYCEDNGFNENYYFLVDMSIHSGKNRFFVYDFISETITDKNLVTHGSCDKFEDNETKWEKAKFSNAKNSHCSSKGKFKIGKRDYSSWGINVKYWLHGLEPSNNNAVERVVVLHSWNAVKNKEIYPKYSPLSWGCPARIIILFFLLLNHLNELSKLSLKY
jgi:hypothetical protein